MNVGRGVDRAVGFVVHNWPLKVAAIALATLLYAGLVASQDASNVQGPITIETNPPPGTVITNLVRDVESIRYIAPAGSQRPRASDFRAAVDLTNVQPDAGPVNVPVRVTALDPDVTIIGVTPSTIRIVLESSAEKEVPVRIARGVAPDGIDVGEATAEPDAVTVRGASSAVARVVAAEVTVALDPGGLDVDREIEALPVDANGERVTGVDVEPATVHVEIPLFTNKESRTLPVSPVIAGSPAPGFRIASVTATPLAVTVEGDEDQVRTLVAVDTAPVSVAGATADVVETVALALPSGITATGTGSVRVTVVIEALTETRTFGAGLRPDGGDPDLEYDLNVDRVLLTLFGPVGALDQLSSDSIVVSVNVDGLGPGDHEVTVVPEVDSGVRVVAVTPETVIVTVRDPAVESPPASAGTPAPVSPAPTASASPPAGASPSP
ncbi:MAG TPA: CdaR family protein [Candidatus Limnocylindrales bacterium]|nr:CdaR family protein [Candidatus Limnocylindrales bacterium]